MMADKKDNRYYISQEIFIRKLIPEILKKAKYLTSEIIIKRLPEYYHITFLYYRIRNKDLFSSKTSYLINLIKFIIEYLFNVRVYIQAIEIQNYTMNAKILSE
jgi:ribosomal protein S3